MSFWRSGGLFNDGPSLIEKIDMLITDVETEGKKQGYDRAANEYKKVYREIENEFMETKNIIENQKNSFSRKADELINKLEALEKTKAKTEEQVNTKAQDVAWKYDIPVEDVNKSLTAGTLLIGGPMRADILGMIYKYKERKLREAEQRGFAEAKELYENKINKLKAELRKLKENGDEDIQNLVSLIDDIFVTIAEEKMKIAELEILL